ncbi:MAG: hypothetical protein QCH99_00120 [Candidatus Bathyarchaeota archaeon]|nr:hypothetical protein [Candidatus Bathyarchaeum tardum]
MSDRSLPWHLVYTMISSLGLQKDLGKFRIVFSILCIILHGVTNYFSATLKLSDYVAFALLVSLPIFASLTIMSRRKKEKANK